MGLPNRGEGANAQTTAMGGDRGRYPGADRVVQGQGAADRMGRRNPLIRALVAWLALVVTGLIAAFTGQLDWVWFGHPVAGERFPFVAGLALSAWVIGRLGRGSEPERRARNATLASVTMALLTAPIDFHHLSLGWQAHQIAVFGAHVGLCAQLLAWQAAARKAQGIETRGVAIMAAGMAIEAFGIFPVGQLANVDAACDAGMVLTCVSGSPFVAIALPLLITLALVLLWLRPLERRLHRGRGGR